MEAEPLWTAGSLWQLTVARSALLKTINHPPCDKQGGHGNTLPACPPPPPSQTDEPEFRPYIT